MVPIYGHHQSARSQASTSARFVCCALPEAGDIIHHFPPLSKIMQSSQPPHSLWCRQSEPAVYISTESPMADGLLSCNQLNEDVCNVKIFVYERLVLEKGNFSNMFLVVHV